MILGILFLGHRFNRSIVWLLVPTFGTAAVATWMIFGGNLGVWLLTAAFAIAVYGLAGNAEMRREVRKLWH